MQQPDIWLEKIFFICGGNEKEFIPKDLLVTKLSSIEIESEKNEQIMNKFINAILNFSAKNELSLHDFKNCYSSTLDQEHFTSETFFEIKEDQGNNPQWQLDNISVYSEIDKIKQRITSCEDTLDNSYMTNLRLSMLEKQLEEVLDTKKVGVEGEEVNKTIEDIYLRLREKEDEMSSLKLKINGFDGKKQLDVEKFYENLNQVNYQFSSFKLEHLQLLEQHRNLIYELEAEKRKILEITEKLKDSENLLKVTEANNNKKIDSISHMLGLEDSSYEDILSRIEFLKKRNESLNSQINDLNFQEKTSTQLMVESEDNCSQISDLLEDKHKMALYIEKLISRIMQKNPELLEKND